MSQSRPTQSLPERPSLEQLKKQAKDLRASAGLATLAAAQRAIAQQYGYPSWPKLKLAVDHLTLRRLIEDGDAAGIRALVAAAPAIISLRYADGCTPIHVAAGENRPEAIDALVAAGASPDATLAESVHTALSWAVTSWAFDAARKLIALGVAPDLFCAAGLGLMPEVQAFWKDGRLRPHPSTTGSSRYTEAGEPLHRPPQRDIDQVSDALYIACRCDQLAVARWLLDRGADPNFRGYAGATCLAWAEFSGNAELTMLLRERGGSDEVRDYQYQATPKAFALMVFAGWGFARKLIARLEADRSLVTTTGDRGTLLHAAADGGQVTAAKILLAYGADRAALDPEGRTACEVAKAKGHGSLGILLDEPG